MHHIIIKNNINDINNIIVDKNEYKEDFNHLYNSLRVKINEKIKVDIITDDIKNDKSYIGIISDINEDNITISYDSESSFNELPITINLYQGIPKLDKLEFIIEKTTELGVSNIIPIAMRNCVKKLDDNFEKKKNRFEKIAKQAAIQCMRHNIPNIKNPLTFDKMLEEINSNNENVFNLLCYENTKGVVSIKQIIKNIEDIKANNNTVNIIVNVIIGPEGGFDNTEIEKAIKNNITLCSLGDRIFRTETAPIVILSQFINI